MYLQKFVNLDLVLPTQAIKDSGGAFNKLVSQFIKNFDTEPDEYDEFMEALHTLRQFYELEARTIERIVVLYILASASGLTTLLRTVLAVWVVKYPHLMKKFQSKRFLSASDRDELMYSDIMLIVHPGTQEYSTLQPRVLDHFFVGTPNRDTKTDFLIRKCLNKLLSI
jgi:hypothetical protein